MPSLSLRSKLLLLICAPLLGYIVSLWGCLEFWIVPKAIEKLAKNRADTVSKSVDNYIQVYLGKYEDILEANKNAIANQDLSGFLRELESSDNNQDSYAKIFIIDGCGGIIASSDKDKPLIREDNIQGKSVNNNKKCNQSLVNIKDSAQNLIKEKDKTQKITIENIINNTDFKTIETLKTKSFVVQVTPLNYHDQQKWLTIVAVPKESIGEKIRPWIILAKILCILLAIVVGMIFWFFVARPIISSIKSLTKATEEIENKDYQLPSLKDASHQGDELGWLVKKFQQMAIKISDREQNMEQKLEQQQLELKREPSIKQELEQLKQETNIQKKAERVMQIIERHELQQLINNKQE